MSSWRLPGRFWAPCGPNVAARRAPNGAWGRPGEPKQIVGWTPGPLRGAKLIDFRVPGGSREASEGGSGVVFWDFVRSRGAGKQGNGPEKLSFSYLLSAYFLYVFLCCLAGWSRRLQKSYA